MDAIIKNQINRFLQRFGIRLLKAPYYKFAYDRENFLEIGSEKKLVIFDIGANIGQSSIWFAQNFPTATVYAFEPFPVIFSRLKENTLRYSSIKSYEFALGNQQKTLRLRRVEDPFSQTSQVAEPVAATILKDGPVDEIAIELLDEFCSENSIDIIHVLKTDTEGYDLEVLEGAKNLLKAGKIRNIVSEVSVIADDKQHTNFYRLKEFLAEYDFELFSLYDLHHNPKNGRLEYFDALFKKG